MLVLYIDVIFSAATAVAALVAHYAGRHIAQNWIAVEEIVVHLHTQIKWGR